MRCLLSLSLIVLLGTLGCTRDTPTPQTPAAPSVPVKLVGTDGTPFDDFLIGKPVQHANLQIFPISSKEPKTEDRFITLDEGLAAGTVKIVEVGAETDDADADDAESESANNELAPPLATQQTSEALQIVADVANEEVANDDDSATAPPRLARASDAAEVNRLMVINSSGKPLYLMPGEVISGGQQDRTIGQEIVIQSTGKPTAIDAFCVEQGRWRGRSVDEATQLFAAALRQGGTVAATETAVEDVPEVEVSDNETDAEPVHVATATDERADDETAATPAAPASTETAAAATTSLSFGIRQLSYRQAAEDANKGKFTASVGQLTKGARIVVNKKDGQSAVWEQVAELNNASGNGSPSGNFAMNFGSAEIVKKLQPYLDACGTKVEETSQVVGVVVAINGKVETVDIFESTPLFKKFWPKLLKSYALDATATSDAPEASTSCNATHCTAFLTKLRDAKVGEVTTADGLRQIKRVGDQLISFSVSDEVDADDDAPSSEAAAGGFGGVHVGGFAH